MRHFSLGNSKGLGQASRAWRGLAALLVWVGLGSSAAQAQDWKLLLGPSPTTPSDIQEAIALRPNVRQGFYLFVQKPANAKEGDVLVRLQRIEADGKASEVLAETTVAVPDEEPVLVRFGGAKPEPKPAEAGKPPAPAPEPSFAPLTGPPFRLRIEARRPKAKSDEKPLASRELPIRVLAPSQYVQPLNPSYKIDSKLATNRLTLQVTAQAGFEGPPCPVELVLVPELIPGLRTTKKDGNLKQNLLKAGDTVELVAENLSFDGPLPKSALVALSVDGYPRAFYYAVDFERPDSIQQLQRGKGTEPRVRLLDDRQALIPVEKVALRLEVDNAPSTDVRLEIGVDRNRDKNYTGGEVQEKAGERQQLVSIAAAGPGGAILFKTEVRDWQIDVETAGFHGKLPYRVRMLDATGASIPVRDHRDLLAKNGTEGYLIFDGSPPELVRFADAKAFPRELVRGQRLRVEATGTDRESDISRVSFFVGKPAVNKEGKPEPPPTAEPVKAEPVTGKADWWAALLPVPDRAGMVPLTAQFVNGAGQSTYETIEIRLVESGAAAGAGAAKTFKISGNVVEGDAAQPGLNVLLKDDKGAVKGAATTSKDPKNVGAFTFENVAPGAYTVSSSKVGSNTKGETNVVVGTADVTGVEVKLYR